MIRSQKNYGKADIGLCFDQYVGALRVKASVWSAGSESIRSGIFCTSERGRKIFSAHVNVIFAMKLRDPVIEKPA
jgi:hypothetical protein